MRQTISRAWASSPFVLPLVLARLAPLAVLYAAAAGCSPTSAPASNGPPPPDETDSSTPVVVVPPPGDDAMADVDAGDAASRSSP
ncbi:MAG: hypothetical protein ACRENE_26810, partial [Polyangiaceae bacterium]